MAPSEKQRISHVTQQALQFGTLLKVLRLRYGLKQLHVLTHLSGWTQTTYSRLELGELAPAFDQLPALYSALRLAGIEFTPQERRQFVTLARERIEAKRSRQEHRTEREWDELRLTLAHVEQKTDEHEDHRSSLRNTSPRALLHETRHLIGREDWLRSVLILLYDTLPKKLVVLQGPVGIGKSSELHRLALHVLSTEAPRASVVLCDLPATEHDLEPESALDLFLATILAEVGPPGSVTPMASLNVRVTFALEALELASRPTLLLLDNAEHLLDKKGRLSSCWEQFLVQFLRYQHRATLILATKEWHGWSGRDGQFVAEITVPLLTQKDSVQLLQRLGLEKVPIEYLNAISERVAGIPLCLEWIVRLVHDPLVLDEWWDLNYRQEIGEQNILYSITQRITRLLEEPTLLDGHLATQLAPLLRRILADALSKEAHGVLELLSVSRVSLREPALQRLCPHPSLLKELRDASLLVASPQYVQVLPMVAASVNASLSSQKKHSLEEQLIAALALWLDDGYMSMSESGVIIAELGTLYLRHYHFLDAAQLLTRYGWLSFNQGYGLRLARLLTMQMAHFDWHTTEENESGGILLQYLLSPFLGKTIDYTQQMKEYQHIQDAIVAKRLNLQPLMDINVTHQLLVSALNDKKFEEALKIIDTCSTRLKPFQATHSDLQAALLEERALLFARWSEYILKHNDIQEASLLREQAIDLYRQCIQLLGNDNEQVPFRMSIVQRSLARCLNNLSYHLNSIGQYEEALEMVERGIALKEKGYAYLGALAASYGEKSQILAALGRFQEALVFDEKAIAEVRRCADAGDTLSQEEMWIYYINRGRLYLRLGNRDKAEQIIREALPHVHPRRRIYQMFAEEALQEIEQWRQKANSSRHQLDWRWIEKFRILDAFDAYWWWAHAGPFTKEEQQQWDQLFSSGKDEATKAQLGKLIAQSRERELAIAIAEQREPRLNYPAIDINEVRQRITALLQLDHEISQEEPNIIVRRLYHDRIEEEIWFLRMIEATYEGNNEQFWEFSRRMYPPPSIEAMQYALSHVQQAIRKGLRDPGTLEISQDFIQLLRKQLHHSFDPLLAGEEAHETLQTPIVASSGRSQTITYWTAKRFFEAVLQQGGYDGWHVEIDPKASGPRVEAGLRTIFLQEKDMSLETVKHYLAHELAGHVARSVAGEHSSLGLLAIGTKNYSPTEEGMALYTERQTEERQGNLFDDWSVWFGTLVTGLASGVVTPPQTFSSLFTFLERFFLLWRLVEHLDKDIQSAQEKAQRAALSTCLRVYRGVPDLQQAGICLNKDAVYLRGLWLVEHAVMQDATILDRLAVGKVALEYLPDVQELGIVASPQSLQKLVLDPNLDAYIRSFENM